MDSFYTIQETRVNILQIRRSVSSPGFHFHQDLVLPADHGSVRRAIVSAVGNPLCLHGLCDHLVLPALHQVLPDRA